MPPTAKRQLIELRLGYDLAQYVEKRQTLGLGWRRIAEDLHNTTGLSVSHEALRSWFVTDRAA